MYHERFQHFIDADDLSRFHLAALQIKNLKTKPTKRALRLALENAPNSIDQIYKDSFAATLAQPMEWLAFPRKSLHG